MVKDVRVIVGFLFLWIYILFGDIGYYDGVIVVFEVRGLNVVLVFCFGFDMCVVIEVYMIVGDG